MRVLFLGDVVANAGRAVIKAFVPDMVRTEKLDFVVANGENASGGLGIDQKTALEILSCGVDLITGGNHSWDKREVAEFMERDGRVLRPANYPSNMRFPVPGKGFYILEKGTNKIAVLNVMGRVHMDPLDCPFACADEWIAHFDDEGVKNILVDIHAEASSEKQAFAHYLSGRVSAVVGSHTHVQTADERILTGANGKTTAFITDAGMTGPYDSVIGMRKEKSIARFLSKMPQRYEPAEGKPGLHGVIIDIDANGQGTSIVRVSKFLE